MGAAVVNTRTHVTVTIVDREVTTATVMVETASIATQTAKVLEDASINCDEELSFEYNRRIYFWKL